jgi:hypothetical protein
VSAAPAKPVNPSSEPRQPERDALDRILRSQVFDRAPNLVLFLRYVCEMQLSGRTDAIKEYNIAVEGLGRDPTFDQKKDSIVRVEAHRLRRRLAEYYKTAGAGDPIEILLPAGSYIPVFRPRPVSSEPLPPNETATIAAPPQVTRRVPRSFFAAGVTALVGLTAAAVYMSGLKGEATRSRVAPAPPARAGDLTPQGAIRIVAGGPQDRFFFGGEIMTATPRPIRRTPDPETYLTRRQGDFEYRVPVPPGLYEVRLHFAETVFGEDNVAGGGESSRVFGVQVNGGEVWIADIVSEAASPNTANIRVYRGVRPGTDGTIRIAFAATRKEAPFVNAIEILPSPDGRMLPVRIAARTSAVKVPGGEEWLTDRYWLGGQNVLRHEPIIGPEESSLYQGERYGNFSYAIPVAMGSTYSLTLRFAETWFGEGRPGASGIGTRIFEVYCNGQVLLKDFDVLREAGGPMRQIKKVFRGLQPNAQGKLNLQFVPIRNYAMINAIEVMDEGR